VTRRLPWRPLNSSSFFSLLTDFVVSKSVSFFCARAFLLTLQIYLIPVKNTQNSNMDIETWDDFVADLTSPAGYAILQKPELIMSRRSCYGLEITNEDIAARINKVKEPTDEQLVRRTSQFIRRKRNSFKDHRTLSDVDAKYYSLGSVRAQLHSLSK